jgi:dihydrofolate synthase/folylpolyglutamate synthase
MTLEYKETLEYLYSAAPAFEKVGAGAYKEGLSNTLALDEHFGHPHRSYHTIHVAGTNGKGSTSHTLAALLQAAGYRTGLYTSPHLADFNERIRIDGKPIPHERVIRFVREERHFFEPLQPSFFELTTALAFKYFEEQQVDIAVIEVGLGGRLDCTNIISPLLCVITNISYDHTGFLGNTLAAIAAEKAGIIKPSVPVVIGEAPRMDSGSPGYRAEDDVRRVFQEKAREAGAPIRFADDRCLVTPQLLGQYALKGSYQARNLNTVLNSLIPLARAMKHAGLPLTRNGITSAEALRRALTGVTTMTGLMGRWQQLSEEPTVICDTGHNLAAWEYLAPQIEREAQQRPLRIVFGMVDDKDIHGVLQLLPSRATYYFTQADTHRAIPVGRLTALATEAGLCGTPYPTVAEAYHAALTEAPQDAFIFVGGSSYVVADLLSEPIKQG